MLIAAHALAEKATLITNNLKEFDLNFPWAPAKEAADAANPKNRYPNINNLKFQRLYSSQKPLQHAV